MSPYIVGNWKMHGNKQENAERLIDLRDLCQSDNVHWVVCPPLPYLYQCQELLEGSKLAWGAQTISAYEQGAHTGQVSAAMLKDFGASYAIIGHSERRQQLAESNDVVADATKAAINAGLTAIVCVGEDAKSRKHGATLAVLQAQIAPVLNKIDPSQADQLIIAYEPIWAIGTGQAAGPEDIALTHRGIQKQLHEKDAKFFNSVRILYGGSVKPANAAALLAIDEVDGLLIGGASLDPKAFSEIGQWK